MGVRGWSELVRNRLAWRFIDGLREHIGLTAQQEQHVKDGTAELPRAIQSGPGANYAAMRRVYAASYRTLKAELLRENPAQQLPSIASVPAAARKWATRLLRTGACADEPPHKPGYKVHAWQRPILQHMKDLIITGYFKESINDYVPFKNLEHAVRKSPEMRAAIFEQLNYKTVPAAHRLLIKWEPDVYRAIQADQRERNARVTQVCMRDDVSLQDGLQG